MYKTRSSSEYYLEMAKNCLEHLDYIQDMEYYSIIYKEAEMWLDMYNKSIYGDYIVDTRNF